MIDIFTGHGLAWQYPSLKGVPVYNKCFAGMYDFAMMGCGFSQDW